MSNKRALGRGLDVLLQQKSAPTQAPSTVKNTDEVVVTSEFTDAMGSVQEMAASLLRPGQYQPRQSIDQESLQSLADSIRAQGVVQPIVVRPVEGGFEIIAGERRWRAAQLVGLELVPVVVRKDLDDQAVLAIALIENIQRQDLNPIEEAEALQRLASEFGLTHQQVAEAVGRSRVAVSNLMRLNNLPFEVKAMLAENAMKMGHARALLSLDEADQLPLAKRVVESGLSVRETERAVQRILEGVPDVSPPTGPSEEDLAKVEGWSSTLQEHFSVPVKIKMNSQGKGQITLQYSDLDSLKSLVKQLKKA